MKRDKEELLLGYDLMDELTDDDVVQKKASDIVIKNDDERQLTAVEWYEEAYNEGCDFVFVASQDITREPDKRRFINRFKECYEMLADRFYLNGHTDVQVVAINEKVAEELADAGVIFEAAYSPSRADGAIIQNMPYSNVVAFKVGIHNHKDNRRRLLAFMKFTASLYTLLKRGGSPSSYVFEVFPRQTQTVESSVELAPDQFFMLVDSQFGSNDNSFGPDFYYFRFKKVNMGYAEFEDDLKMEIKESGEEMQRLGIIPTGFEKEAFDIMYAWAKRYLNK